jgi:hypothetical protein
VTLPTDFRSRSENGHSRYGHLTARFAPEPTFGRLQVAQVFGSIFGDAARTSRPPVLHVGGAKPAPPASTGLSILFAAANAVTVTGPIPDIASPLTSATA